MTLPARAFLPRPLRWTRIAWEAQTRLPRAAAPQLRPAAGKTPPSMPGTKRGPAGRFLMRSLSQTEQQTITYNLNQVGATKRTAAPQGAIAQLPGASEMRGRIKEIDLNDPFFERIRGTVTSTADLAAAGVTSMVVKLQYGVRDDGSRPKDTKEVVIAKTGDSGSFDFFMDKRKSITLEYQVVVTWKAGFAIGATETQSVSPWILTTTRNLDIDPQAVSTVFPVTLTLGAVDSNVVTQVQSVVRYADATSNTQGGHGAFVPGQPAGRSTYPAARPR